MQIFNAKKPDFSYFIDDSQSPLKDILKGLTRNGTSIGTVGGPDFINYAPCFIRCAPLLCSDSISLPWVSMRLAGQ